MSKQTALELAKESVDHASAKLLNECQTLNAMTSSDAVMVQASTVTSAAYDFARAIRLMEAVQPFFEAQP